MSKSSAAKDLQPASNLVVASNDATLPAHLTLASSRGNENVGKAVTIPRLKLLQKMSDQVDKHHALFVEGAEAGLYYNSVTNEIYGEDVYVISLNFTLEYAVWRDMDLGGGYRGNFATLAEANARIAEQENPKEWQANETHAHVLMVLDPTTGEMSSTPCVMDFTSSKLPVSRTWNTNIGLRGGDRFAGVWKLGAVAKESKAGKTFYNTSVEWVGWATEENYKITSELYDKFDTTL
jgi:hypothetical protein